MKASELRIGNFLKWEDETHDIIKVIGINESKTTNDFLITYKELLSETKGQVYSFEFIPIPLTEDWLLKFGFEKRDGEIPENIDFVFKGFWIEQQSDVDDFICLNTEPFVSVEYVHQLQNLYYALTGEEL